MDTTPREIEAHIDRTRERLGSHLEELGQRVEAATDWREYFRTKPQFFLGAAFAGGATLAVAMHMRSQRPVSDDAGTRSNVAGMKRVASDPGSSRAQVESLWHNLKGALIGVASARVTDYLSEFMPDFADHYRRAEQRTLAPAPTSRSMP